MQFDEQNPFGQRGGYGAEHAPPKQPHTLLWVLGGIGVLGVLCCGAGVSILAYVGIQSPETSVYTGNRVPHRFLNVARETGALEDGETVKYFYSDAFMDIRDGFCFVSDRKVAIYTGDGRETPLMTIPFESIESVELHRNESFFEDSEIILTTIDGDVISFPVSSEYDRDVSFADEIKHHVDGGGETSE